MQAGIIYLAYKPSARVWFTVLSRKIKFESFPHFLKTKFRKPALHSASLAGTNKQIMRQVFSFCKLFILFLLINNI